MKHKNIKGKIYVSKSDDFTIRCIFLDLRSPHPFTVYSLCYFSSLFTKRLEHLGDALFLLLHVWVNIEIKGCCDSTPLSALISNHFNLLSLSFLILNFNSPIMV